jgi:hypothetical protein
MSAIDNDSWLLGAMTYIDAYKFGMAQGFYKPEVIKRKQTTGNRVEWSELYNANIKVCAQCRRTFVGAIEEHFHRDHGFPDGFAIRCHDCKTALVCRREFVDRNALLGDQGGCCALCERALSLKQSGVDFDPESRRVRGILCKACQMWVRGIENASWLKAALAYRDHHRKLHRRQMAA